MLTRPAVITKLMKWAYRDEDAKPLSYAELEAVVREYDNLRANYNDLLREKQYGIRSAIDTVKEQNRSMYCDPNDPNKPMLQGA